jgi:signal transduction histidine kinase
MSRSLRARFMLWLTVQTVVVFLAVGGIVLAFNLHEQHEHPGQAAEEAKEFLLVLGLMGLSAPLLLWSAWGISRQLLKPLQEVIRSAEVIRAGQLEHRIRTATDADEIAQLARAINEAFDRYQEALDRLDRFSSVAAHQLRNPLAALRTAGEVALQQARSPAEYRDTLGRVLEDARRLSHTVDQLLTLARLSQAELGAAFEPVDLAQLTRDLLGEFAPTFEAGHLVVRVTGTDAPLIVTGLANLLREALANLLDNAVRFSPAGGHLAIDLRRQPDGRTAWCLSDSGPGLPAKVREAVPAGTRPPRLPRTEGAGLGLLVASDIVRAHRGTIAADTSEWGGARFTICLPSPAR